MHKRIKVVFYVRTKSRQYTENMKCEINVALNHKNEIIDRKDKLHNCKDELLDCMNEIKIKQDYFSIFGENKIEYITTIGVVCRTSPLPLRHSEPDLKTFTISSLTYMPIIRQNSKIPGAGKALVRPSAAFSAIRM